MLQSQPNDPFICALPGLSVYQKAVKEYQRQKTIIHPSSRLNNFHIDVFTGL